MAHTKVTKTYSQNTGTANTFSYSGSFDVFKATEVVALLDNVKLTYTASTINESASPREYTVDTVAKTIHIGGADLSSGAIIIRPETDMGSPTPRATYTPGASITSEDLNNNNKQLLRKAMEYGEQVLFNTGGVMTGDLGIGEDKTIYFEGATDDGYETTLTVTDPTADRTITLPNVTGTVVTTGDTGTVTATMLAADSVDSSELVDGSIDTSHIGASQVTTAKIANENVTTGKLASDAVTSAKLADDACDSEHYTDGSIDTVHIGDLQVTTAKIAADAITSAKLADDACDSEHYTDGSIDTVHIGNLQVTTAKLAADAVDSSKLADDACDSEHYTDGSIDTAHIADANVTLAKLEAVADTQIIVGNGSNRPTAVAVSGDVTIANTGAVTIANDAVEIGMIGCEQTTISDSDSHIPTSGAVIDYVADQIAPIGGLEVIATDAAFPNTQPSSGVVISIADAGGLVVNGSDTSTTGRTVGASTVTINNINSQFRSTTIADGVGMLVTSTGSGHIYNYHKATLKEADLVNLSTDINDFGNRYRVGTKTADSHSSNDDGDLFFDTGANKMYVYDGAYDSGGSWKEVTSAGDYKYLTIKDHDQAVGGSGPTFNGSNEEFDLFDGSSDSSITSAAQLLVVLNGVLQKPNTGTFSGSEEGFYLNDTHGIKFCDPPATGSTLFVTQIGTATTLSVPADGSVTAAKIGAGAVSAAKIGTGAVETAKLAADAVDGTKLADNACDSEHYTDGSIDHVHLANDAVDGDNIADDAINSEHYVDASIDHQHLADDAVDGDIIADNAVGLAHMAGGTDGVIITYDASGDPVHVGPGSDGQVLTSTGAGSPPAFETLPASGTTINNATANELVTVASTTTELDAEANLTFDGNHLTLGDGDLVIGTAGHGISFAATADTSKTGASMANELFDDYEKGTWTADLRYNWSGDCTFTTAPGHDVGTYVKIGDIVHAQCYVYNYDMNSGQGSDANIKGLPFISGNVNEHFWLGTITYSNAFDDGDTVALYLNKGDDNMRPTRTGSSDAAPHWHSDSGRYFMMQITYST